MIKYITQDIQARNQYKGFLRFIISYLRLPSYRILANYRLVQYISSKHTGLISTIFKLKLERICSKYCVFIEHSLQAGKGLSFPHNGPFIINPGAKIGMYCTIHPQVLIAGDRKKGKSPVIGNYVFIGNGAKIIGDCRIGDWCFIAPGAVITKDIPNESVVGFGLNNIISKNGKKNVNLYLK